MRDNSGSNNSFYGRKHSPESLAKMREAHKNRVVSDETKRKISESHMGNKNSFFGRHHSPESLEKISINKKGQKSRLGAKHKPESIIKMSEVKKGNHYSLGHVMPVESRQKLSREKIGKGWSIESRLKMSETYKKKWQDPIYSERTILNSHIGMSLHPNKPETILGELLDELYPGEWLFVGDNKEYRFGRKIPDFIHKTKNLVIEHFGIYPHGERVKKYYQTEEGRIAHFAEYNLKALIIWDVELYNQRGNCYISYKRFL